MRALCLSLVGLGFLAACEAKAPETVAPVASAPATSQPPQDMKNNTPIVVMLGDSLTAGYQLPAGNALPAALQRIFDARGIKAKFVNAGVSGDTTADGLNRYEWSVSGTGADLLVVALGANDFLNELPPQTPKKNLAAILAKAKEQNLAVALVGVAIPGETKTVREKAYAGIYPELAKEYGVPYFADMLAPVAGKPEMLQQDGVHPTGPGVEAMAAALADFLAPEVNKLQPTRQRS
jgi:acyl-CoA thioesterase I